MERELEEKAAFLPEAQWHYIGKLQKSNINRLLRVKGLEMIETVDSAEIAAYLDRRIQTDQILDVLVQVNITREVQKNGCEPETLEAVLSFIKHECKR